MITTGDIKNIVIEWASTLPYKVKIHLFGSFLNENKAPSDIDISLEILEPFSVSDIGLLWEDHHDNWESYLSEKFEMKAHLCLYEKGKKYMPKNLEKASLLLYDSTEKEA